MGRPEELAIESSLAYLQEKGGYRLVCTLGTGSFGDVYRMEHPKKKTKDVAVKLVNISEKYHGEWTLWAKLDCKYLLPLIAVVNMDHLGIRAYVMPLQERSLREAVEDVDFRRQRGSLGQVKVWLYHVLKAMDYLRSRRMCHLDIKSDNVLISKDSKALLCDFSFINTTADGPVKRGHVGLPYIYCPPELCEKEFPGSVRVDGESVDLWAFGAMCVEVLTGYPIARSVMRVDTWKIDICPIIMDALQEATFSDNLDRTFPSDPLYAGQKRVALNFVNGFLMTDPKIRVKAADAKSHYFLNKGRKYFLKKDAIWIESNETDDTTEADTSDRKSQDLVGCPEKLPSKEKETSKAGGKGIGQRLRGSWRKVKTFFKRKDGATTVPDRQIPPNSLDDPRFPDVPVLPMDLEVVNRRSSPPKLEKNTDSNDSGVSSTLDLLHSLVAKVTAQMPRKAFTRDGAKSARHRTPRTLPTSTLDPPVKNSDIECVVKDVLDSVVSIVASEFVVRQNE